MFVTLPGEPYLLWRAVDEHGARTGHPGAETALAFAALFGRFSLFDDLIAHGADPDHADARGNTALATVQAQGNLAAMEALRNVGATH
jgi:ankyrin repeat protein